MGEPKNEERAQKEAIKDRIEHAQICISHTQVFSINLQHAPFFAIFVVFFSAAASIALSLSLRFHFHTCVCENNMLTRK